MEQILAILGLVVLVADLVLTVAKTIMTRLAAQPATINA